MAHVKFTRHLVRFFPHLNYSHEEAAGTTIAEVIADLNGRYPGLADYIVDEHGHLRKHVNIFLQNDLIQDRLHLSDSVQEDDLIYIFQALSGG